jgi:hypothetical protein
MAINALEKACFERKRNIPVLSDPQKKSLMNYNCNNFFNPSGINIQEPKNFDNYEERYIYAMK